MTRGNAWAGRFATVCCAAILAIAGILPVALSAVPADARPHAIAHEPAAAALAGSGIHLAQYGAGPRGHSRRRAQSIEGRRPRQRRQPDAFYGLMTPNFGRPNDCLRPRQIRGNLQSQGWWDFHGLRRVGEHIVVRARRPNGAVYQLRIERCSGRVAAARPLNGNGGYRLWAR